MIIAFLKLRRSKNVLKQAIRTYKKKAKYLSSSEAAEIRELIKKLNEAISKKDAYLAKDLSNSLEKLMKVYLKRSVFGYLFETTTSLAIALFVAVVIRQTWFELYEIPSGSMRPTFKEQDRLVVSKTQFGINLPLKASHILFKPEEVKRGGIVIFTGENMDIADVKTRYFYIFPGTKQYVKRMIGLPGDTLYFYGGKIFGVNKDGQDISSFYDNENFDSLEHIPFIHLEGKTLSPKNGKKGGIKPVFIHQMNIPIAQISPHSRSDISKQLLVSPKSTPVDKQTQFDLYDLWGMGNYATARILTQDQVFELYQKQNLKKTDFYLELTHHANLANAKVQEDLLGRARPVVGSYVSLLPLEQNHIEKIWQNMYTARFVMKNGYAHRYGLEKFYTSSYQNYLPKMRGLIPDGTYEFDKGKAYEVKWQGLTKELDKDHPFAQFDQDRFYTLFNAGMEMDVRFIPGRFNYTLNPARYAYFKDGDLYLLGAKIFSKEDPTLQEFVKSELAKSQTNRYPPFIDSGSPRKLDGSIDRAKIEKFGLTIPEGYYLVLGDNHAMSADSRDFGFVPEDNIRGVPSLIFWASGSRYGEPNQISYPLFTTPRVIIWLLASSIFVCWTLVHRRNKKDLLSS